MDRLKSWMEKRKERARLWVQVCTAALTNGYVKGFAEGKIFTGPSKRICVPGLNCYSCPGAFGSCPIGSLQAVLGSRNYRMSFYVIGFLMLTGALLGRFVCGWLCPFGLIQDLLYKIPVKGKRKNLPGHRGLVWQKYGILAVFVLLLPLTAVDIIGQGSPWFCQYICPAGTLEAGIPLVAANEVLKRAVGFLFTWKILILAAVVLLSVWIYRPFCKYLCPLGAVYSVFNPIALYRYQVDDKSCTGCRKCRKTCGMDIRVWETPNSPECIRCGDCLKACPEGAIHKIHISGRKNGERNPDEKNEVKE